MTVINTCVWLRLKRFKPSLCETISSEETACITSYHLCRARWIKKVVTIIVAVHTCTWQVVNWLLTSHASGCYVIDPTWKPVSQYGLMQAQYSSTGRERSYMYGVKRFERFLIMSSILKFLCTSFRVQWQHPSMHCLSQFILSTVNI